MNVRQSQAIHTWPAGSIIDLPELSLIMLSHDHGHNDWGVNDTTNPNKKSIIKDNRLAEAFKVDHFVLPPVEDGINNLKTFGLRFPRSQYCPVCGLIHFITRTKGQEINTKGSYDQSMSAFKCEKCTNNQTGQGPKLVPMRFVIATEEGFLDDFPWDWYVHKNKPEERNRGNKLYYRSKGGSASLNDIIIESKRNDGSSVANIDLGKIFDQQIFTEGGDAHYLKYVNGFLPKPWKGWHNDHSFVSEIVEVPSADKIMVGEELSPLAKRRFPRTMQRGAGNIIFPIIYSGILLPESTYEQKCPSEVQLKIQQLIESKVDDSPDEYEDYTNEQWKDLILNAVQKNPNHGLLKLDYSQDHIINFIKSFFGDVSEERHLNRASLLREQEFKAFTSDYLEDDKVWFKKRKIQGQEYNFHLLPELFDEIVMLEKLSAMKIYRGFTRIKPLMGEELVFADLADNLAIERLEEFQRIQDARKDPIHTRELPAVEVRGEGIFVRFNNKTLNEWAMAYPDGRLKIINDNLQSNIDFNQGQEPINKRYLLLHTLSHIILKELAEDSGYSLSSLAEIIYCSSNDKIGSLEEMNGILIYTTSSDSEGSLGGLVEKGKPNSFTSIIKKGVDKARWCSSDPLCISAESGQGFMGLNLAACYSCVLLPETSCERMNKYLDRASVIGTLNQSDIGLFNHQYQTL